MEVWDAVDTKTMNACWNHRRPTAVNDFRRFPTINREVRDILQLARPTGGDGFEDLTGDDVHELIDPPEQEPTNENLVQMVMDDENAETNDEDVPAWKSAHTIKVSCSVEEISQRVIDKRSTYGELSYI